MLTVEGDEMGRLADWVLGHRRIVVLTWLALAVVGGVLAPTTIDRLGFDFSTPGQPAYEANQAIVEQFGTGGGVDPLAVTVALPEGSSIAENREELAGVVDRLRQPGWRVASPLDEGAAADVLSADGTAVVLVWPPAVEGPAPYAAALPQLEGALQGLTVAGVEPVVTGTPLLTEGGGEERPIIVEIALGAGGAIVVLVLVFGSLLALVPLLVAAVAITTTFLLVLALTTVTDVSFIVQYLVGLIGLGVAIDYSLLVVMRWREERAAGADDLTAVRTAMTTAGRAVVFSGVTVAISLLTLVVLPLPFLRTVGFGGLFIPLVSVLVALTLLPVVLASAGRRLEWPRREARGSESRAWRRIGTTVVRHRWVSAVLATALLLLLASPVLGIRLGSPQVSAIATGSSPAATAFQELTGDGLPAGLVRPVEVLTEDRAAAVERLSQVEGVAGVLAPEGEAWQGGGVGLVDVVLADDPSSTAGREALTAVRAAADELPGAEVGGTAAGDADSVEAIYGNAWWVLPLVVVVTFALLAPALRSIWLPVKALLLNVVSIAAAYGMTVWIWQEGNLTDTLFGASATGTLTFWVPVAAFSFLFGLSMDYEVFILSRIREGRDAGMSTDEATVHGVAYTGRLVTSAALILFLAFVALSTVPVVDVKIFATTLALGILLDATVVRGVLTPALVAVLGDVNWWWPFSRSRRRPAHVRPRHAHARSTRA
ncbi:MULTISPECIES: MMPL family transporter [unclassified Modestobacter]|uniref:MMPL family transporter n=1 Tax=unclassified Modestobacter TaxID=2643866 RepID=UPI0022AAE037|nr:MULTISPECIES: MMPL family transporter [unclassified Modestobacter]MCZ2824260.1 MMPL family transporter [Modestobacter sp. VKM Ac-2981]MCZ2854212.1 MMPL family transporter [Modestobacter sp. VKM Ac-2982]